MWLNLFSMRAFWLISDLQRYLTEMRIIASGGEGIGMSLVLDHPLRCNLYKETCNLVTAGWSWSRDGEAGRSFRAMDHGSSGKQASAERGGWARCVTGSCLQGAEWCGIETQKSYSGWVRELGRRNLAFAGKQRGRWSWYACLGLNLSPPSWTHAVPW